MNDFNMNENKEYDFKMSDFPEDRLFFEFLVLKGLKRIGKDKNKRYFERLKYEFDRMVGKKYINYFLCNWDFVGAAKAKGIGVGPCRGSAGASLVGWCLEITDIDPIEHDLLFTRFLSSIRRDAPDIDLDFQDDRRQEVYEYLKQKYGESHCAKVATYARFHPKGLLLDIGRIFDIPKSEILKISSLVIERSGGDARASLGLQDTFDEFKEAKEFKEKYPLASEIAMKLEGRIRHKGSHAAAMVVSDKEICEYAPINKIGGIICIEWEKGLTEDMKLIKFDILGLKTLTIIQDAIASAGVELPRTFSDPEVYKNIFKEGNTDGVFQFTSPGMQKFIKGLNVETFEELADATTLYRPGALHSGQASLYANRKAGREEIVYMHPMLEPITKNTFGCILYQEQIMHIMNKVGAMSWATAEMARKVITKSKGKNAFEKMRNEFVANAVKINNFDKAEAEQLYDTVSMFGSYSFNKTHAFGYSMISYYCAWLKNYYPQHFFKALLKFEKDSTEIKKYTNNAKANNIFIGFPDINKSEESYCISDNKIIAGLLSINGLGSKTAQKIINNRPYASIIDFKKKIKPSSKIFIGLVISDAFREFNINKKKEIENIDSKIASDSCQRTLNSDIAEEIKDYDKKEISQMLYEYTDLVPDIEIGESYDFGNFDYVAIDKLKDHGKEQVFVRGIVTEVLKKDKILRVDERHPHQFEKRLLYLNLSDGTGNVACQVNPETFEKYQHLLENIKKKPVLIFGKVISGGGRIMADMIEVVDGPNETRELRDIYKSHNTFEDNESYIVSARPAVSKKGNSYYRIRLLNGSEGLLFKYGEKKLFPGMKVEFSVSKPPFINIKLL